jgi:hypothetical protein
MAPSPLLPRPRKAGGRSGRHAQHGNRCAQRTHLRHTRRGSRVRGHRDHTRHVASAVLGSGSGTKPCRLECDGRPRATIRSNAFAFAFGPGIGGLTTLRFAGSLGGSTLAVQAPGSMRIGSLCGWCDEVPLPNPLVTAARPLASLARPAPAPAPFGRSRAAFANGWFGHRTLRAEG